MNYPRRGEPITEEFLAELAAGAGRHFTGTGVTETPDGVSIDIPLPEDSTPPQFYNADAGTAPAGGIMAVTSLYNNGSSGSPEYIPSVIQHATLDGAFDYLINGDTDVPSHTVGNYQPAGQAQYALFDTGSPTPGTYWSCKPGQWSLTAGVGPWPFSFLVWGVWSSSDQIVMGQSFRLRASPCWATTAASVSSGDATFSVNNVIPLDGYVWNGTSTVTVNNTGWKIASGQRGLIVYGFLRKSGDTPYPSGEGSGFYVLDMPWQC